jgi:hypothetical protein
MTIVDEAHGTIMSVKRAVRYETTLNQLQDRTAVEWVGKTIEEAAAASIS